jgi:hypothetical protein
MGRSDCAIAADRIAVRSLPSIRSEVEHVYFNGKWGTLTLRESLVTRSLNAFVAIVAL